MPLMVALHPARVLYNLARRRWRGPREQGKSHIMIIAVLGGTGPEGLGVSTRLAAAGDDVVIGSRSAERAQQAAATLGARFPAAHVRGDANCAAAASAELVVV